MVIVKRYIYVYYRMMRKLIIFYGIISGATVVFPVITAMEPHVKRKFQLYKRMDSYGEHIFQSIAGTDSIGLSNSIKVSTYQQTINDVINIDAIYKSSLYLDDQDHIRIVAYRKNIYDKKDSCHKGRRYFSYEFDVTEQLNPLIEDKIAITYDMKLDLKYSFGMSDSVVNVIAVCAEEGKFTIFQIEDIVGANVVASRCALQNSNSRCGSESGNAGLYLGWSKDIFKECQYRKVLSMLGAFDTTYEPCIFHRHAIIIDCLQWVFFCVVGLGGYLVPIFLMLPLVSNTVSMVVNIIAKCLFNRILCRYIYNND